MGFSRQEYSRQEVVCHSPLQWTTFCQTSPRWPAHLGWPHTAWLSFTELDKAVSMWSDRLVFCDYGFRVSALWCPLTAPTILLGFLLTWTWGISSWLLQQSTAAAPYLGRGVSPHSHPSWFWTWNNKQIWPWSMAWSRAKANRVLWRDRSGHSKHPLPTTQVNTKVRLIIFFAAKDGEALYSQQKQDWELTVAQTMNSLLPNSDLNWRKWGKLIDHSGMT